MPLTKSMERQILLSSDWEVGGDFSLTETALNASKFLDYFESKEDVSFLSTCRSAITEIIKSVSNKSLVAFVPSFTCHVCVEPFIRAGFEVYPYKVEKDLTVDWIQFEKDVVKLKPSIVLIHSYFGINTIKGNENVIKQLRETGVTVIEDLTHGMFSSFDRMDANYLIGSIRKWFPIPDGAFIKGQKNNINILQEDEELVSIKEKALLMKGYYLEEHSEENRNYREVGIEAERFLDSREHTYLMSSVSKKICNSYDINMIKNQRRENYNTLYDCIAGCAVATPVLGKCSKIEIPYMFPVFIKEQRADFQKYMVSNKVFPTIIWGCPDALQKKIDKNAQYIYEHILCFHCDQRYSANDMKRVGELILKYTNNYK